MKVPVAVFLLLATVAFAAETKSPCSVLLKADSILYAGKQDETIDSVTVCEDGKVSAFHSFTAPKLAGAKEERTRWDYGRELDQNILSDLKAILGRSDIARLPERVNAAQRRSEFDLLMHFTIVDHGQEKNDHLTVPISGVVIIHQCRKRLGT